MELPFAVTEAIPDAAACLPRGRTTTITTMCDHDGDGSSSLVSTSSRGSLTPSEVSYDPILRGEHPYSQSADTPAASGTVASPAQPLPPSRLASYANTSVSSNKPNTTGSFNPSRPTRTQQPLFGGENPPHPAAAPSPFPASAASSAQRPPPAFAVTASPSTGTAACDERTSHGLESVLSQFGVSSSSAALQPRGATAQITSGAPWNEQLQQQTQQPQQVPQHDWLIDDTYVTVSETDDDEVDIVLAANDGETGSSCLLGEDGPSLARRRPSDVWALLLAEERTTITTAVSTARGGVEASPVPSPELLSCVEQANRHVGEAAAAKQSGNLAAAVESHARAAQCYRHAAWLVQKVNASMSSSFLLLSQTQAKTAVALKKVLRLRPLADALAAGAAESAAPSATSTHSSSAPQSMIRVLAAPSPQELLRAKVRGALSHQAEADISDSVFMGRAGAGAVHPEHASSTPASNKASTTNTYNTTHSESNPVDDMMELERELRNMDLAMEMGSSIASLEARTQHRMKNSMVDGSFMVVAPSGVSNSYLSSSTAASTPSRTPTVTGYATGTASARARANRVQTILEASNSGRPAPAQHVLLTNHSAPAAKPPNSLDSSWWGNASQASQVLTSSVISLASGVGTDPHHPGSGGAGSSATSSAATATKQLLLHMDTFKTLRDENEALLKEVVGAKAARLEAQAAKEQVRRFKDEYTKRFAALKMALERHRKESLSVASSYAADPVASSEFARSASASEQLARQEQLIKKLTADLKKEKEESKKKDSALLKYETFYREVKARSAAKAAQRQNEASAGRQPAHAQRHARQSARFPR